MKETLIVEQIKTHWPDLVAQLGGIAGLFTGFSILSPIEIVEILFHIIKIVLFPRKKSTEVFRARSNGQKEQTKPFVKSSSKNIESNQVITELRI